VAGAGVAKLQVAGRPVREWVPLLAGWAATRVTGRRSWRAPLPLFPTSDGTTAVLPPVLQGIDVIELRWRGRPVAAVRDRRASRLTAVLPVDGAQFACQDPAAQDALLAGWGDVVGGNAAVGSPVVQVGWSDLATPSGLVDHRAWAHTQLADGDGHGPPVGDPASYQDLLDETAAVAVGHESVVWVTVGGAHTPGTGKPADRAEAHLPAAIESLTAALHTAGLSTDGPLSAAGLWRLLRQRIDPADDTARPGEAPGSLARRLGLIGAHNAGPLAIATGWSHLQVDGAFHRLWWVETWPRRPQPGDWLHGFLSAGEPRTMTVLQRPLDPERSQRRIESQLVKLTANRVRKADRDRRVTEADERTEQAVRDLETELASGYSEVLYLGLVCVSAPTLDELDAAGRRVEHAARAHGMGLRVLHGRQDVAWAASLPFGLAEPGLLEVAGL
jgi:hypothetical protein